MSTRNGYLTLNSSEHVDRVGSIACQRIAKGPLAMQLTYDLHFSVQADVPHVNSIRPFYLTVNTQKKIIHTKKKNHTQVPD